MRFIWILTSLCYGLVSCIVLQYLSLFFASDPQILVDEYQTYSFNPNTILQDLAIGLDDLFTPISSTERLSGCCYQQPEDGVVVWDLAEYLAVAEGIHNEIWGESTTDWKPSTLLFELSCNEVEHGPQSARIRFHKEYWDGLYVTDYDSSLIIGPQEGIVYTQREVYAYPSIFIRKEVIDIKTVGVSPKSALEQAENQGGDYIRESVNNNCYILILLNPRLMDAGWMVEYFNSDDRSLAAYRVNVGAPEE